MRYILTLILIKMVRQLNTIVKQSIKLFKKKFNSYGMITQFAKLPTIAYNIILPKCMDI